MMTSSLRASMTSNQCTQRRKRSHICAPSSVACRAGLLTIVCFLFVSSAGCARIAQAVKNEACILDPDAPFHVQVVEPSRQRISMMWRDSTQTAFGTIEAVRERVEERGDSIILITNGGIYEPGLIPTGLYIERGVELQPLNLEDGAGNFYLKPNGVFLVTEVAARVVSADDFTLLADSAIYATQSGPLLLDDGEIHPGFTPGSENCRLRSGVGVSDDGRVYFVLSNGAISFYDFAIYFREALGVRNALYLDGGISEMYAPALGLTTDPSQQYATMIVVTEPANPDRQ